MNNYTTKSVMINSLKIQPKNMKIIPTSENIPESVQFFTASMKVRKITW